MAAHPDRVHLLPAADATLLGLAVGMALAGDRPVVELAGPEAIPGALQQLIQEAAGVTGDYHAPVVVRVPVPPGRPSGVGSLLDVVGLSVAAASSPAEAGILLQAALQSEGPVVLLEPAGAVAGGPTELRPLPLGRARVLREGADATLLAWSDGVPAALRAAESLAADGVEVDVVDLRTLVPLDLETVSERVQRTGRFVLVGAPASVLAAIVQSAFLRLESPPEVISAHGGVAEAVHRALDY
jgi:pyruvate/2-oxoglutarate/acetoin dehydrogenase E1 component